MSGASICEAANKEKGMFDSDKSIAQKRDAGIAKEVGKYDELSLPPVGKVYQEAVLETGDPATRVSRVQSACAAEAGPAPVEPKFKRASEALADHDLEMQRNLCSPEDKACNVHPSNGGTMYESLAARRK